MGNETETIGPEILAGYSFPNLNSPNLPLERELAEGTNNKEFGGVVMSESELRLPKGEGNTSRGDPRISWAALAGWDDQ